jgi:hypothetical protein
MSLRLNVVAALSMWVLQMTCAAVVGGAAATRGASSASIAACALAFAAFEALAVLLAAFHRSTKKP